MYIRKNYFIIIPDLSIILNFVPVPNVYLLLVFNALLHQLLAYGRIKDS